MMNYKNFPAALMMAAIFLSCNSPVQNKQERAAHDSANAPVHNPTVDAVRSVQLDTVYKDYRIAAIARGNGNLRDLVIAVGSVKDTTQADSIIETDVKGQVRNMMIADLDGNGKPELYFYMLSEGTGRFGKIYAYDLTGKVARISTNAIDTMERAGYRGQDSFYIKGKSLVRTFPMYREGDPDVLTSNNTRKTIEYNLKENGDTLKLVTR
jgi:hypothetical protein